MTRPIFYIMSVVDEVRSFAREYVNHSIHRTATRKEKIREAHYELFGRKLAKSCATCYIEAVFKIINFKPMATSKYELKKGVVLQAFGHPEKTCTNNTITDELGDWYMKHFPEKTVFFAKYPRPGAPVIPAKMTIVPPVKEANPPAKEGTPEPKPTTKKRSSPKKKPTKPVEGPEKLIGDTIADMTGK